MPIKLDDFLEIAKDNDRRIWQYERETIFELYMVAENVISYTELPKEGLNYERVFTSKPFIGSKILPVSLKTINNYNIDSLNKQLNKQPVNSVPVYEEEMDEIQPTEVEEEEKQYNY